LLRRRVTRIGWHHADHALLLLILLVTGALLWSACGAFILSLLSLTTHGIAVAVANYAVASFVTLGFFLTLSGLWFGYWIRREVLQATHLILIGLAGILINMGSKTPGISHLPSRVRIVREQALELGQHRTERGILDHTDNGGALLDSTPFRNGERPNP
jgi:hypothetical protein